MLNEIMLVIVKKKCLPIIVDHYMVVEKTIVAITMVSIVTTMVTIDT